jgi:hypothetical protein
MWFLFGFITLTAACISSLLWRLKVSWHGSDERAGGIAFEYDVTTYKSRVSLIRVGVACEKAFTFTLKPEGTFDRFSKAIGLTKECQTGNAAFDDTIYVLSDDLALHRMLQLDANLRDNIMRLVEVCNTDGKLKSINAHNGRLWVVVDPVTRDKTEAKTVAGGIAPALDHLAGAFATKGGTVRDDRDPFPFRAACVLAVSTGLAINGAVELARMIPGDFPFMRDTLAPAPGALILGVTGILVLIVFALWFMGRSARTHLVLIELLLVGSFGAVTTAYAELRDFNMEYDRHPIEVAHASVAGTYDTYTRRRRGGKTRHCHVRMIGWPVADRETEREMSCGFADRLHSGTMLDVRQHAGALGWPWIEDFVIR